MTILNGSPPSVVMLTTDQSIDRRILLEADSLEAAGWKVTILAFTEEQKNGLDDHRVVRLWAKSSSLEGPSAKNIFVSSHLTIRKCLPDNAATRVLKDLFWKILADREKYLARLFAPTALKYAPTVFVAHDLPMLPVAHAAARACGAKLVYDSHELFCEQEFSGNEQKRWKKMENRYIRDCDAILTVNPSLARELELIYGLEHVEVIMNAERPSNVGVGKRYFHESYGLADSDIVLLYQGGFSAHRNLETLVEAFHLIENQALHLVFLGEGIVEQDLKARAKSGNARDRIHFHPKVPQASLLEYTGSADVGIIPYAATCRNNLLCTPNKLFEFVAAGLPILSTDLPEIRRLVIGYGIGAVGCSDTPEQFADFISKSLSDNELLTSSRLRVKDAAKYLNWEVEGERLVRIFNGLLN